VRPPPPASRFVGNFTPAAFAVSPRRGSFSETERPNLFEVREKVGLRGGGTVHVALEVLAHVPDRDSNAFGSVRYAAAAASARRRVEQFVSVATLLSGHKGLCDGVREDLAAVFRERTHIHVKHVHLKFAKLV
jgi:hypothetical protein